jgi:hypothetical protein
MPDANDEELQMSHSAFDFQESTAAA